MRVLLITISMLFALLGCINGNTVNKYDGNMTDEKVEKMQAAWCEYNKDREFIKNQCSNY